MKKDDALAWAFLTLVLGQADRKCKTKWNSWLSLLAMGLHRAAFLMDSADMATVLAHAFSTHGDEYDVDGNSTYYGPKRFPPKDAPKE